MHKTIIALVTLLTLCGCMSVSSDDNSNRSFTIQKETEFEELNKAVVRVRSASTDALRGTGVIVGQIGVLTAGHICEHPWLGMTAEFTLETFDGARHLAQVVKVDLNQDICLLSNPRLVVDYNHIPLAKEKPEYGDELHNIANPGSMEFGRLPVFSGRYSGVSTERGVDYQVYTIPSAPGSSGSPVFTSEGKLVGLICFSYNPLASISMGPGLEELSSFLDSK